MRDTPHIWNSYMAVPPEGDESHMKGFLIVFSHHQGFSHRGFRPHSETTTIFWFHTVNLEICRSKISQAALMDIVAALRLILVLVLNKHLDV